MQLNNEEIGIDLYLRAKAHSSPHMFFYMEQHALTTMDKALIHLLTIFSCQLIGMAGNFLLCLQELLGSSLLI